MRSWSRSVSVVLAVLCVLITHATHSTAAVVTANDTETSTSSTVMTAFLCADSGDYSGAHELGFLYDALEERKEWPLSPCQSVYSGFIRHADGITRTHSLVVTSGIGYISAALCTRRVVNWEKTHKVTLNKMVWIGTSGFSPMVGGWDPTNTSLFHHEEAMLKELQAAVEIDFADSKRSDAVVGGGQKKDARGRHRAQPAHTLTEEQYKAQVASEAAKQDQATVEPLLHRDVNFELFQSETQLDADGCSPRVLSSPSSTTSTTTKPLSVGSICVTSSAFLQESGLCTETVETNQCSRPHCYGFLGKLINRFAMDDSFAREIMAASSGKSFPDVPVAVREGMRQYWYANDAVVAAATSTPNTPHASNHSAEAREHAARMAVGDIAAALTPSFVTCAESTMNAIFVGAERDYLCREHTADLLTEAERRFAPRHGRAPHVYTPDEVVCVQAMEAYGFLQSVSYDAPDRAVAVIRTASNYDAYPQHKLYLSNAHVERLRKADAATNASTSTGKHWVELGPEARAALANESDGAETVSAYVWSQNTGYVAAQDYDAFVMASFHYSVKTAAFVLSNYFFGGRDFTAKK